MYPLYILSSPFSSPRSHEFPDFSPFLLPSASAASFVSMVLPFLVCLLLDLPSSYSHHLVSTFSCHARIHAFLYIFLLQFYFFVFVCFLIFIFLPLFFPKLNKILTNNHFGLSFLGGTRRFLLMYLEYIVQEKQEERKTKAKK